ncbi:MAG: hypothetical protein WBO08_10445, partial [Mycobacterium sp.]
AHNATMASRDLQATRSSSEPEPRVDSSHPCSENTLRRLTGEFAALAPMTGATRNPNRIEQPDSEIELPARERDSEGNSSGVPVPTPLCQPEQDYPTAIVP